MILMFYKINFLLCTLRLASYRVYIRLCKHGCDITAPLDARICSCLNWEALTGLRTNKENLLFGSENKARYSQQLLLDLRSRAYTAAFKFSQPSRVCITLYKHGKTVSIS